MMGRIGTVISFERTVNEGSNVADVLVDPGGGANVTAEHFADAGDDSQPLPGDAAAIDDSVGTGVERVTGYSDPKNAGKAGPGEKRTYARAPDGTVVAEIWAKASGDITITSLKEGGAVNINGVIISKDGAITAPKEITAMAASPATSVTLSEHTHGSGTGPTTPPTPGT